MFRKFCTLFSLSSVSLTVSIEKKVRDISYTITATGDDVLEVQDAIISTEEMINNRI
jgi:hypothetical protein